MSRKKKSSTLAVGTAVALSLAAMPAFTATSAHPFQAQTLKSPYLAKADNAADAKPADAKPADTTKNPESKSKDAHCGGKMKDGTCGADKKMKDGKCGESKPGATKMKDGKCGEGTCGGTKK